MSCICHHTHTQTLYTHTHTYHCNENIYFLCGGWSELLRCERRVLSLGSRLECRLVWLAISSASLSVSLCCSVCLSVWGGLGFIAATQAALVSSSVWIDIKIICQTTCQSSAKPEPSRLPLPPITRAVHGISTSTSTTCDAIICLNVMLRWRFLSLGPLKFLFV